VYIIQVNSQKEVKTMRKAVYVSLAVVFSLIFVTSPCRSEKTVVLKLGNIAALDHNQNLTCRKFAELVAQKTKNGVKIEIYPNSQLGPEVAMQAAVKAGTLEMCVFGVSGIESLMSEYGLFNQLYLFRNEEQVKKVMSGPVADFFRKKFLADHGIVMLSQNWGGLGTRHILAGRPILKPSDAVGLKIRVPGTKAYVMGFKAIGASPTAIPFSEVYLALQQGTVDAMECPFDWIYTQSFWEVKKVISLTAHSIGFTAVQINERVFMKLPKDGQNALQEAAVEAAKYSHQLDRESSDKYYNLLKKEGVKFYEVDIEPFRQKVRPVLLEFVKERNLGDILRQIEATK
jgi:tripartite ATP-independent transporter DctP family solute receptor